MPISEAEWEQSDPVISWTDSVYEFLDKGYPTAYSAAEITNELFEFPQVEGTEDSLVNSIFLTFVLSQLEELISRNVVEARSYQSEDHENTYFRRKAEVDDQ